MRESVDVVVIGAGFSGLGLAYEAASNGFSVVVFESAPAVGTSTSDNSLRIVHGGFRYLQSGAVGRMLRSARALSYSLRSYPEYVTPLSSLLPLSAFGTRSIIPVSAALMAYHTLAQIPCERRGRIISSAEFDAGVPELRGQAPFRALQWWDGQLVDPRGLLEKIRQDAEALGVEFSCGNPVRAVTPSHSHVIVESAGSAPVRARLVFNAAGPQIEAVELRGYTRPQRRWCSGFNLVFRTQLTPKHGVAGAGRGRLLFAVPRGAGTAVGTWYRRLAAEHQADLSEVELKAALGEVHEAYPGFTPEMSDIIRIETGVLPMGGMARSGEPVPRGPEGSFRVGRYVELLSTKFTTFAIQAAGLLRSNAALLR
ncbi:MAG: FAD-dependent oxidoreductase [Proteobacteria bacterium]|nr:FAD-dependent oxidoreductase [Pseudomonadota bacterium]